MGFRGLIRTVSSRSIDFLSLKLKIPLTILLRWALEQRYKLLPYLKTLDRGWYNNSLPIVRPVFLEHPDRDYLHHWTQFFLGEDILVAPVLDDNTELVNIHFPMGTILQ